MFSLFSRKKPSPTQNPAEPIPGAGSSSGQQPPVPRDDEFIFIERRGGPAPADDTSGGGTPGGVPVAGGAGLYPSVPERPQIGGGGDATMGNPVPARQRSVDAVVSHALHGVPFRLSADIGQPANMEITRIQANEILTYVGRMMYAPDYDFSLERSVLQED